MQVGAAHGAGMHLAAPRHRRRQLRRDELLPDRGQQLRMHMLHLPTSENESERW
jgi:hypothetical protein